MNVKKKKTWKAPMINDLDSTETQSGPDGSFAEGAMNGSKTYSS